MPQGDAIRIFDYPDIHFPYQDPLALEVAKKAQAMFKPHKTVVGGDLLDCAKFSGHRRSSMLEVRKLSYREEELDPANAFLDYVQENTEGDTYLLEGNHENRLERLIANGPSVLHEFYDDLSPRTNLSRGRSRFKYVPWVSTKGPIGSCVKLARNLVTVHGWYTTTNAARRHLEASKPMSILYHHTHRMEHQRIQLPWKRATVEALSAGCLCKLAPLYMVGGSPANWSHGFAVIYVGRRSFSAYTVPIHKNYCILPSGEEVRV